LKQLRLAEALKITAELTVQEWKDVGLAVTRMVDVHVNRHEEEEEEEEEGGLFTRRGGEMEEGGGDGGLY